MGAIKGVKREYFPKVREAREALKERAAEILESYISLAAEARAAGEFDVAAEILWKLIDHIPEEDGERMIDGSVDKPKQVEGQTGPSIQIGIALGGMKPKQLEAAPIDIEAIEIDNE